MDTAMILGTPLADTLCPHCGRTLRQITYRDAHLICYTPRHEACDCPEAERDRALAAELESRQRQEAEARRRREHTARLLDRSGIRPRYRGKTFDSFARTADNKRAFDLVKAYAGRFGELAREGKGLYLYGGCGVGKTHLATALALELMGAERSVLCLTGVEILSRLRQAYDGAGSLTEQEILGDYLAAELLIIDDLGKENTTEWSLSVFYSLINMRIGDYKPLVITTNYTDGQLVGRLSRAGDEKTARAIVSRLHEVCYSVEMGGPDHRGAT